jgi:hypothetical protein
MVCMWSSVNNIFFMSYVLVEEDPLPCGLFCFHLGPIVTT